jgi:hypothetical protein
VLTARTYIAYELRRAGLEARLAFGSLALAVREQMALRPSFACRCKPYTDCAKCARRTRWLQRQETRRAA